MKRKVKEIIDKKYLLTMLVLLAGILFIYMSVAYADFYQTMRHGITFWDAFFAGDIQHFYRYCAEGGIGYTAGSELYRISGEAAYDITIYIIFALWNFPMWVIEKIFLMDIQNTFWGILYGKGMILVFLLFCVKETRDIACLFPDGKIYELEIGLALCSSAFILLYVISTGNYDIITVAICLAGVKAYLQNDLRKFFILFCVANTIKYLSLFLFIPLILLKFKDFFSIIKGLTWGVVLIIAEKMFFRLFGSGPSEIAISRGLLANLFDLQMGNYSLFILAYAIILFSAWCIRKEDNESTNKWTIILGFVTYGSFVFLGNPYPYWIVFFVPFVILFSFIICKDVKTGMLLETCLTIFLSGVYFYKFGWVPDGGSCLNMFLYHLVGKKAYAHIGTVKVGYSVGVFLRMIDDSEGIMVPLCSLALACFILLLVLPAYYRRQGMKESFVKDISLKSIFKIRIGCMLLIGLLPPMVYGIQMVNIDYMITHFPTFY